MRPADSIKDLFKQAQIQADADQTERVLGDALQELQKRSPAQGIRKRPSRWRLIMNSKTTQLSAAAVVLLALGLPQVQAHGSLRFTLGKWTTDEEINRVLETLPAIVTKLRAMSPLLKSQK